MIPEQVSLVLSARQVVSQALPQALQLEHSPQA